MPHHLQLTAHALACALTRKTVAVGLAVLVLISMSTPPALGRNTDETDTPAYEVLQRRDDRLIVKLPNRLIIIAQEIPTAPVVSVQGWVRTGSIYEQEFIGDGLSHFLEHLVSGGSTSTRTEEESNAILGRIGAQTNAATSLNNVNYYINTTSDNAVHAIDLLSDWLQHSQITDLEYQRERQVIQREFENGRGDPGRIFWRLTQQVRYQQHPARHPTIGYFDDFLEVTRDEIYAFYKRMYVPNNIVFVVAGKINKDEIVRETAARWADAKANDLPEIRFPIEPTVDAPRELTGVANIRRPRVRMAWPGVKLTTEHDYALDLLGGVLGDGESSRLIQEIRDKQKLASTINAYNLSFTWGEGYFGVDAELTPGQVDLKDGQIDPATSYKGQVQTLRKAVIAQIDRVKSDGVTDAELARAKRKVLAGAVYSTQTAQAVASQIASNMLTLGDPDYRTRWVQAIQKITSADIQAAANAVLDHDKLITVVMAPAVGDAPPTEMPRPVDEVDPNADEREGERVTLDNSQSAATFDLLQKASTANITGAEVGEVISHTLPNGMRLLIQRNTLSPSVSIQMYRLGGLLTDMPGQEGVASASASMAMRGTTTRSSDEIHAMIEDLGAELGSASGNNTYYTTAISLREDWPTVMELMADVTLHPTFPQAEWDKIRPLILAGIDRREDSWYGELSSRFRETYFGEGHPWSQLTSGRRDVVASLTADDLKRFHEDHLSASQTVMAVFGDVDPAKVLAEVTRLFADMPERSLAPFVAPDTPQPEAMARQFETKKRLAAVMIGMGPGVSLASEDHAAIEVMARVLSDFPVGWLERELRGTGEGLVYAVWAGQVSGYVPGYFAITFNTRPDAAVESATRAMKLVGRLKTEAIDDATLARAKAAVLSDQFLGSQSNGQRAMEAALAELYGVGEDPTERLLRKVAAIDAAAVQLTAQTYLENPVLVIIANDKLPQEALDAVLPLADPSAE